MSYNRGGLYYGPRYTGSSGSDKRSPPEPTPGQLSTSGGGLYSSSQRRDYYGAYRSGSGSNASSGSSGLAGNSGKYSKYGLDRDRERERDRDRDRDRERRRYESYQKHLQRYDQRYDKYYGGGTDSYKPLRRRRGGRDDRRREIRDDRRDSRDERPKESERREDGRDDRRDSRDERRDSRDDRRENVDERRGLRDERRDSRRDDRRNLERRDSKDGSKDQRDSRSLSRRNSHVEPRDREQTRSKSEVRDNSFVDLPQKAPHEASNASTLPRGPSASTTSQANTSKAAFKLGDEPERPSFPAEPKKKLFSEYKLLKQKMVTESATLVENLSSRSASNDKPVSVIEDDEGTSSNSVATKQTKLPATLEKHDGNNNLLKPNDNSKIAPSGSLSKSPVEQSANAKDTIKHVEPAKPKLSLDDLIAKGLQEASSKELQLSTEQRPSPLLKPIVDLANITEAAKSSNSDKDEEEKEREKKTEENKEVVKKEELQKEELQKEELKKAELEDSKDEGMIDDSRDKFEVPQSKGKEDIVKEEEMSTTNEVGQNLPDSLESAEKTQMTPKRVPATPLKIDSSFDTLTLSPVKDTPKPDLYFHALGTGVLDASSKPDLKKHILEPTKQRDVVDSDTETVAGDSPPHFDKAKQYIRKNESDRSRLKRKHRNVLPDEESFGEVDDEDEDEGENPSLNKRPRPADARSLESLATSKPYKIKRDSGGRTLLQRACKKGDLRLIKEYLARGADANEKDFGGFTCLHEAALEGNTEVVELLLSHGANVNAKADAVGAGETPLIDAAENKHLETVKCLLRHGADPTIYNIDGLNALTKILNDHGDEDGYEDIVALLEKAIEERPQQEIVASAEAADTRADAPRQVIDDPHDMYFADLLRKKQIYKYAAEGTKEQTATYFVQGNLLSAKPDILFLAARNGHSELVDIILGLDLLGFDLDTENDCGTTALLAAVGRGHLDTVELLLSKGADPFKIRHSDNRNALQIAQTAIKYDPKEVVLIQQYMDKKRPQVPLRSTSKNFVRAHMKSLLRAPLIAPSDDEEDSNNDEDVKSKKHGQTIEHTRHEVKSEDVKPNLDNESQPSGDESNDEDEEEQLIVVRKRKLRDRDQNDGREAKRSRLETLSKDEASPPRRVATAPTGGSLLPQPQSTAQGLAADDREKLALPSPHPEHIPRERDAEQARAWQQKQEAKKKARRDMFLKAEREKERLRQQEIEMKHKEEQRVEEAKSLERERQAHEAEQHCKLIQEKRLKLQQQLVKENYPEGLLAALGFDGTVGERLDRFGPLYVFEKGDKRYVVDLQLALMFGLPVSLIDVENKSPLQTEDKQRIWRFFYRIIGGSDSIEEGCVKFGHLLTHFLPETEVTKWADENLVSIKQSLKVAVDLNNLELPRESRAVVVDQGDDDDVIVDEKAVETNCFVPPNLRGRKDAMKVLQMVTMLLW